MKNIFWILALSLTTIAASDAQAGDFDDNKFSAAYSVEHSIFRLGPQADDLEKYELVSENDDQLSHKISNFSLEDNVTAYATKTTPKGFFSSKNIQSKGFVTVSDFTVHPGPQPEVTFVAYLGDANKKGIAVRASVKTFLPPNSLNFEENVFEIFSNALDKNYVDIKMGEHTLAHWMMVRYRKVGYTNYSVDQNLPQRYLLH